MEILIKAAQLFLSLSILIIVHELGHFIPAKLFKTRVEKFYLFFNPWFSLFKVKVGETIYGLGWLPLGGYVKIAGMVDESMDKEQLQKPAEPWEFRSKPAWQRLIIMIGGVTVNLIVGIFIYAMILFTWGETYLPNQNVTYGVFTDSLGRQLGIEDGDRIVAVDGKTINNFRHIPGEIIINQAQTMTVERDGRMVTLNVPDVFIRDAIRAEGANFVFPRFPTVVEGFPEGSKAPDYGLMKGDSIIAVNGLESAFFNDFRKVVEQNKGGEVLVTAVRGEDVVDITLPVDESGLIGFMPRDPLSFFKLDTINYGIIASFPAGVNRAYTTFEGYVKQFGLLFNPDTEAYKHVGGFITIGRMFTPEWNWLHFWSFTAFLSIVLAFMNMLPIPALDGGHVVFTLYEMVSGRKPSLRFMEYAQVVGMVLLLSLLVFANGNDIYKLFTR